MDIETTWERYFAMSIQSTPKNYLENVNTILGWCSVLDRPNVEIEDVEQELLSGVVNCLSQLGLDADGWEIYQWGFGWPRRPIDKAWLGQCLMNACSDANTFTSDGDNDLVADVCDNCPDVSSPNVSDFDQMELETLRLR